MIKTRQREKVSEEMVNAEKEPSEIESLAGQRKVFKPVSIHPQIVLSWKFSLL
jgi:hypothetical protein